MTTHKINVGKAVYSVKQREDGSFNAYNCSTLREVKSENTMRKILKALAERDHSEALEMDAEMTAEIESIRPNMACMTMTEIGQYLKECHAEALDVNAWIDDLTNKGKVCSKKLDAFCFQVRDEDHAEALEENKRFDWLHNRWCLFHSSSRLQQEEIIGVAWERARHIIEADEVYNAHRQRKLEAIWKHTHQDYKGESEGVRSILVCRNGTTSVPLESLTDVEIEQRSSMWQRNK